MAATGDMQIHINVPADPQAVAEAVRRGLQRAPLRNGAQTGMRPSTREATTGDVLAVAHLIADRLAVTDITQAITVAGAIMDTLAARHVLRKPA
jgi:hypothetical protein